MSGSRTYGPIIGQQALTSLNHESFSRPSARTRMHALPFSRRKDRRMHDHHCGSLPDATTSSLPIHDGNHCRGANVLSQATAPVVGGCDSDRRDRDRPTVGQGVGASDALGRLHA